MMVYNLRCIHACVVHKVAEYLSKVHLYKNIMMAASTIYWQIVIISEDFPGHRIVT